MACREGKGWSLRLRLPEGKGWSLRLRLLQTLRPQRLRPSHMRGQIRLERTSVQIQAVSLCYLRFRAAALLAASLADNEHGVNI